MTLQARLEAYQRELRRAETTAHVLRAELASAQTEAQALEQRVLWHEQALVLINAVTEAKRKELATKVENLISYGLSQIFEKDYRFVLHMEQRGQQVDFQFRIRDPDLGDTAIDLFDARGGGLVQVVAFLLRLLVILSARPPLRRFLFLDEPLRMVSEEYVPNLCSFIKQLAVKADFQFLLITHDRNLIQMADKAYQFKLVNGATESVPLDIQDITT
jgi:DNA repair ATPase RecN